MDKEGGKRYLKGAFIVMAGISILALFLIERITPHPKYAGVFYDLGLKQEKNGNFKEALGFYRKAVSFKPYSFEILNRLGVIYHRLGNYDKAIECLQQAIAFDPKPHEPYDNLGLVYQSMGRLDDAILCSRKALMIKPNDQNYLYHQAVYYLATGDGGKAVEIIRYLEKIYSLALAKGLCDQAPDEIRLSMLCTQN